MLQGGLTDDIRLRPRKGRHAARKGEWLLPLLLVTCLGCVAQSASMPPDLRSNGSSPHAPCAKYKDIRNAVLGNIGVKIDVAEPWAGGFRRALSFWNNVVADLHEEAV